MMEYYYMNKENGNLVTYAEMWQDAEECGYEDILDPTSVLYRQWKYHYNRTVYPVHPVTWED